MSSIVAIEKVKKHLEKAISLMELDIFAHIHIIEEKQPAVASYITNHITQFRLSEYIEIARMLLMICFCFEENKNCQKITQELLDQISAKSHSMLNYVEKDPEQINLVAETVLNNTRVLEIMMAVSFMVETSDILFEMPRPKRSQALLNAKILTEAFEKCCTK